MMTSPRSPRSPASPKSALSAEELNSLLLNKAIELLARREHSADELNKKLALFLHKKTGLPNSDTAAISALLAKLHLQDLQSDERFTEAYCRSRIKKGFGRARILLELNQRGIAKSMAANTLDDLATSEPAFDDVIYRTWHKKFKTLPDNPKDQAKQYRFLQYRGFTGGQISALYARLKQELD